MSSVHLVLVDDILGGGGANQYGPNARVNYENEKERDRLTIRSKKIAIA